MTPEDERRQRRISAHARYNASEKGQARNKRYEAAHPDRRERWSLIMRIKAMDRR